MPMQDVFNLYVDAIIHDSKKKKGKNLKNSGGEYVEWVTSKNATWH